MTPSHHPAARTARRPGDRAARCAFTIIEILVVVAIMGLLITLVVVAGNRMSDNAKINQTKSLLSALSGIATEFEMALDGHADDLMDVQPAGSPYPDDESKYIRRFVEQAKKVPALERQLNALNQESFDGEVVVDAWGRPLMYARRNDHDASDPSAVRNRLPEYAWPFFASAGPDGDFGDVRVNGSAQLPEGDNLYSYELKK
ncbi:MAG: hypothetical protein CMJ18_14550 [Phycisphaeraceae bacterium]|nr:hypothetical protein [Phycisphaeraceae bacterium]